MSRLPRCFKLVPHERFYPALAVLAAATLTVGCAVQTTRDGKLHLSIDEAELIGETVQAFTLADGNQGKIRRLGRDFSIKLEQYLRVIPIQNATAVSFIGSRQIGERILLVVQKSERNCAVKTQIISIKGPQVSVWDFGDCANKPAISYDAEAMNFDFNRPGRTMRYVYRDNKLLHGELRPGEQGSGAALPGTHAGALDPNLPRYTPPLPIELGPGRVAGRSIAAPAPAVKPPGLAQVKPAPRKSAALGPDKAIEFKGQEQKATITLILDNK